MSEKEYITEWSCNQEEYLKKKHQRVGGQRNKAKKIKPDVSLEVNDASNLTEEKKQKLLDEKEQSQNFALAYLPTSHYYSKSFMHKEFVNKIVSSVNSDFIFTTSIDGVLKFWKKKYIGIEFVKQFKAHPAKITGITINQNGTFLTTCSCKDEYIKIFDIINFDMINFIKLPFTPYLCEYISKKVVAVSEKDTGNIYIINTEKLPTDFKKIEIHSAPVTNIKYNAVYNAVISTDSTGMIEYWDPETFEQPFDSDKRYHFKFKIETDLYEINSKKTSILSLEISPNGKLFGIYTKNKHFIVFNFLSGKIIQDFNESKFPEDLDEKLIATEKEIDKYVDIVPSSNINFDETGQYLYYPSAQGIKLIEIETQRLLAILGKKEEIRFLYISLFQGKSLKNNSGIIGTGGASSQGDKVIDPIVFALGYKKNRIYLFDKHEPNEQDKQKRDVLNEKIVDKTSSLQQQTTITSKIAKQAILETSLGEIHIKLFPEECKKTVENFVGLANKGYYDNLIFHRVIKGFMIQTGDPKGNGTGGESLWGGTFEDEFNDHLQHDAFMVSMANCGPNTNGSQFFITTVPCPWLNKKHTIFGKVFRGMDTVKLIEKQKVDKKDKPLVDIKLCTVKIIN